MRDRFGVPHIVGRTRDDVTWGDGLGAAAGPRAAARPGPLPGPARRARRAEHQRVRLVTGLKTVHADRSRPTGSSSATACGDPLAPARDGRALLHDVDVFLDGINARLKAEKSTAKPFTRADIFAVNALVGQIFGAGRRRRGAALAVPRRPARPPRGRSGRRRCSTTSASTTTPTARPRSRRRSPTRRSRRARARATRDRSTGGGARSRGDGRRREPPRSRRQAAGRRTRRTS